MRKIYLLLAVVGFLVPNALVLLEMIENHNILLWTKPEETMIALFANRISTIFALDLLLVVLSFFVWSFYEGKRLGMKRVWLFWLLTLLFGLAGSFPLFLRSREKYLPSKK